MPAEAAPSPVGQPKRARRQRRHRIHGNPFSVLGPEQPPNWPSIFGRDAPLGLEIGFGAGEFTLELAAKHPDLNVIGVEIRPHLASSLNQRAKANQLANLHALVANANQHLGDLVPNSSLTLVVLNFPDPWFKARHHKRRVLNPEFLDILASKCALGAELHAMTDYPELAAVMLEHLESSPDFHNLTPGSGFAAESTTGILSRRERTHTARGQRIYRLRFGRESRDSGDTRTDASKTL